MATKLFNWSNYLVYIWMAFQKFMFQPFPPSIVSPGRKVFLSTVALFRFKQGGLF
jgi:hypothetical protein